MKNQYFGDNRDLFKYDLVMKIIQAGLAARFTHVPMLTAPDGTGNGGQTDRRKARAGHANKELAAFLDGCVSGGKRDIKQIEGFLRERHIPATIYGGKFSHAGRGEYFRKISDGLLAASLVLVDPDNGLEVGRPGEKHLLFDEVKALYERLDSRSVLMFSQRFPAQPHLDYLNRRAEEIKEKVTGDWPVCVDDDNVIFFFLARDGDLEHALVHLVEDYTESYTT